MAEKGLPCPASCTDLVLTFALLLSWPVGALGRATPEQRGGHASFAPSGQLWPAESRARPAEHLRTPPARLYECSVRATLPRVCLNISLPFSPAGRSRPAPSSICCVLERQPRRWRGDRAVAALMGPLTTNGVEHERKRSFQMTAAGHRPAKAWPPKGAAALTARLRCSAKARVQGVPGVPSPKFF